MIFIQNKQIISTDYGHRGLRQANQQWHKFDRKRNNSMKKLAWVKFFTVAACFVFISGFMISSVSADGHGRKKRERSHERDFTNAYQMPAAYKESCGSCHMAYGAYLLPEASWRKMLDTPDDHFGDTLGLDAEAKRQVLDYLLTNAADRNGGKIGRKIMKHSQGNAQERISTLPYIQRKHRKIASAVFNRPSVGGLQNCIACHAGAEQGDFDDDRVSIPR
jgi:mono/diheme cytochrome c family protein